LVVSAIRTAWVATFADWLAFLAISWIDTDICSVLLATACVLRETSSAAVDTSRVCAEVSAALDPSWWLTEVSCTEEAASASALRATWRSGSTRVSSSALVPAISSA
jgi:hypothetical protein